MPRAGDANEGDFPRRIGRYDVFEAFARGGMATVHLGRLVGDRGFSRLVAVKMLARARAAASSAYARALEEEARVTSRIRHPNVAAPLDVVEDGDDLLLVMEYVHGVSLAELLAASRDVGETLPSDVVVKIVVDALEGLHAAHEAVDELGRAIGIVHRDVSPQNVLVGADGIARLADFGVAKAMRREERTETGIVKGKPAYMPPEQKRGLPLTRQADLYAVGVVLAEALSGASPADAIQAMPPGPLREIVLTATRDLARDRFATASEMAAAICEASTPAQASEVGRLVSRLAGDTLDLRSDLARKVEQASASRPPPRSSEAPPRPIEVAPAAPRPSPSSPRARARARDIWLGVALLFVLLGTLYFVRSQRAEPPLPAAAVTTIPSPDPTPAVDPPIAPSADPSVDPSAEPSTATSAMGRPLIRTKPARTTKPSASSSHAQDCDPPFSIGPDGKKHYKPECLR